MDKNKIKIPSTVVLLILLCICGHASSLSKTYFVWMTTNLLLSFEERNQFYTTSLESMSISSELILYVHKHFDVFSVSLTNEEARAISTHVDVISVHEEELYNLHTIRTPGFMGMDEPDAVKLIPGIEKASQVVIGFLDNGVWPESLSFNDDHLGPVPSNWKGGCDEDLTSVCNRKLVGARLFSKGHEQALKNLNDKKEKKSARDRLTGGHGTHTMSTAGGSAFPNASMLGFANGTARGMAQFARVAMYKVCWSTGCHGSDIIAAMDQAIEDGVDVLSLSLGSSELNYYKNSIAIGAFAAVRKGILVSCSPGNDGPAPSTLSNFAPWILTVGAGTLDRGFLATLKLGNNETYYGVSLYKGKRSSRRTPLPMVYAREVSTDGNNSLCEEGSLVHAKVVGKIVLCDKGGVTTRVEKGDVVRKAGGLGMVLANTAEIGDDLIADAHMLPATAVTYNVAIQVKKYLASNGNKAIASFRFRGTVLGVEPSPLLAAFSSRGPNPFTPEILKPDLIAPGVNILAAWPKTIPPTISDSDNRSVDFNIMSGTSMSCPHVSGLAALLKAAHKNWSPAAIRSALMTTAYSSYENGKPILDAATGKPATPYGSGAGHVHPMAALDPGLVYDLRPEDYNNFLCTLNYTAEQIKIFTKTNFTCNRKIKYRVSDLNYPSFVVSVGEAYKKDGVTQKRTLTNVGPAGTYKVSVLSPSSLVNISVDPEMLTFDKLNQKKSYEVTFKVGTNMPMQGVFGRIEWSDDDQKHVVGSPVAFN